MMLFAAEPIREAAFLTGLRVFELMDGRKMLLDDLVFYSRELHGIVVAPKHSITDYASVPQGFWNLFPPGGVWKHAAVLHDGAYRASLVTEHGHPMHLIKPLADRLFYEAMGALGVSQWKRWLMWKMVVRYSGAVYGGLGTAAEIHEPPPAA